MHVICHTSASKSEAILFLCSKAPSPTGPRYKMGTGGRGWGKVASKVIGSLLGLARAAGRKGLI